MSVNISLVRDVTNGLRDTDGNYCDFAMIVNRGIARDMIVKPISSDFKNDYELIEALASALASLKNDPRFAEKIDKDLLENLKLDDKLTLSNNCKELLSSTNLATDFAKKTFFALNNNMLRFELRNGGCAMAFVDQGDCKFSQNYKGSLVSALPDMMLAYNANELRQTINEIKGLKISPMDLINYEKAKKIDEYCKKFDQFGEEYLARNAEREQQKTKRM